MGAHPSDLMMIREELLRRIRRLERIDLPTAEQIQRLVDYVRELEHVEDALYEAANLESTKQQREVG